jgi:hypothetical protein
VTAKKAIRRTPEALLDKLAPVARRGDPVAKALARLSARAPAVAKTRQSDRAVRQKKAE